MDKFNADAGRAILSAARLDSLLQQLLLHAMPRMSRTVAEELFENRGPLSTFSAKIIIARAMGLIDAATQRDLRAVKALRNLLAHADRPVHFTSREVIEEAKKKKAFGREWTEGSRARVLFEAAADRAEVTIHAKIDSLTYDDASP